MGMNRVIVTAGQPCDKKEKTTDVVTNPGEVLMNVVNGGEIHVTNATASAIPKPLQIVDYSSQYGLNSPWKDVNREDWDRDQYVAGDQIPLVYPRPGCEVMVMAQTNTTWAVGTYVACAGDGQVMPGTDETDSIGICLEDLTVTTVNQMIKMEVL